MSFLLQGIWHIIKQVSSATYENFSHLFAKGNDGSIIAQGEEQQKLSRDHPFQARDIFPFFSVEVPS